MIDWNAFPEQIVLAGAVVIALGGAIAGAAEFVKRAITLFGWTIAAEGMTIMTGVISAVLVTYILVQQGTVWPVAVLAVIAAIYGPKVAHDAVAKLKPK